MPVCISFYSNATESDVTDLVLQFAINHPGGAGHFPGNPIIPGALLLDEILSCIADRLPGADKEKSCLWQVKSAKFRSAPATPYISATYKAQMAKFALTAWYQATRWDRALQRRNR
jgi:3-hydroxymyristoyl/3-hydroxydecanoyl-(acyl carrier protein) dehydratase